MFLYRKGNQSFGMCKQKGEKNIKILDFLLKSIKIYEYFACKHLITNILKAINQKYDYQLQGYILKDYQLQPPFFNTKNKDKWKIQCSISTSKKLHSPYRFS